MSGQMRVEFTIPGDVWWRLAEHAERLGHRGVDDWFAALAVGGGRVPCIDPAKGVGYTDEVAALMRQNLSGSAIARELGIPRETVRRYVNQIKAREAEQTHDAIAS